MSAKECKYSESYPVLCYQYFSTLFQSNAEYIYNTLKVQRLNVCYTDLQNLASNLVDEARPNAKGKLNQSIQSATWHNLDN